MKTIRQKLEDSRRGQERYRRLIAERRCPRCRAELPQDYRYVLCDTCRQKNIAYLRGRYATRKAAGLCVQCGQEVEDPDHIYCDMCLR